MPATVDYYFSLVSPFSYLGHASFLKAMQAHNAAIAYKPINLFDVFKSSGALPVPERPASRQAYRLIELQRVAEFRGLPIVLKPKHWPTSPALAHGAVLAIVDGGGDPSGFMQMVYQACWSQEQDIAEPGPISAMLAASGFDAGAIMEAAKSDAVTPRIAQFTEEAIAVGAVGAPVYVLDGEPYWGQDRIEYLDHALTIGRGPFSAG